MKILLLIILLAPPASLPMDQARQLVTALEHDDPAAVAGCCGGPLEEAYRAYADLRRALERLGKAGIPAPFDVKRVEIHRHAGLDCLLPRAGSEVEFTLAQITAGTAGVHFTRPGPTGAIEGTIGLAKYQEGWKVGVVSTGDAAAAKRGIEKLARFGDQLRMRAEVAGRLAEEADRGEVDPEGAQARLDALLAEASKDFRVLESFRDDPGAKRLRAKDVSDRGLRFLPRFKKLEALSLKGSGRITDEGLIHIESLSALRELDLEDCTEITDAGLLHVQRLTGLVELSLEGCPKITDTGMARLVDLVNLERLDLAKCAGITDAGLAGLSRLPRIEKLYLRMCTQLTDAAVEHLKGLESLRMLNLHGCSGLSDAAVDALQTALPGCEIRR